MDPQQRLVLASSIALWAHGNTQDAQKGDAVAAGAPKSARRAAQGWATFVAGPGQILLATSYHAVYISTRRFNTRWMTWRGESARPYFLGLSQVEYPKLALLHAGGQLGPYYATGAHLSVAAGRVAFTLGRAVQVDPMKPKLKPPGAERFKLKHDICFSTSAFKFNLRRYNVGWAAPPRPSTPRVRPRSWRPCTPARGSSRSRPPTPPPLPPPPPPATSVPCGDRWRAAGAYTRIFVYQSKAFLLLKLPNIYAVHAPLL